MCIFIFSNSEIAIKLFSSRTVTASSISTEIPLGLDTTWTSGRCAMVKDTNALRVVRGLALKQAEVPSIGCNLFPNIKLWERIALLIVKQSKRGLGRETLKKKKKKQVQSRLDHATIFMKYFTYRTPEIFKRTPKQIALYLSFVASAYESVIPI